VPVQVREFTGYDHRAAGRTDRVGTIASLKDQTFFSDPVYVRRFRQPFVKSTDGILRMIIRHDHNDVRSFLCLGETIERYQQRTAREDHMLHIITFLPSYQYGMDSPANLLY
jgi:hypothetical protein